LCSSLFLCECYGRSDLTSTNFRRSLVRHCSIVVLAILLPSLAFAQGTLIVYDPDPSGYPTIKAKCFVVDDKGNPIQGLSGSDFTITENGIARNAVVINCPDRSKIIPITAGVMINTYSYIPVTQQATARLLQFLALPPSEMGITIMDNTQPAILQDLTQQSAKITAAIPKIHNDPALEVQKMFYDPVAGGVPFVTGRPNPKVLILITDMHCPHFEFDEARFYADAKRENIRAYTVILGSNDYRGLFKRIADNTGGKIWENVTQASQIDDIFKQIGIEAQGVTPCELQWQSAPECDGGRDVVISIPSKNLTAQTHYTAPDIGIGSLQIRPQSLLFGVVNASTSKDLDVTLTAIKGTITVDAITSRDPHFTIVSGGAPPAFVLKPNETHTLTVRYTPTDTTGAYLSGIIDIADDMCAGDAIYPVGGSPLVKPRVATLKIVKPNGGEVLLVGDDTVVRWKGVPPDEPVNLDYSTDAGTSWIPIGTGVTGLMMPWRAPNTPSYNCLARVTQGTVTAPSAVMLSSTFSRDSGLNSLPFAIFTTDGKGVVSTKGSATRSALWNIATASITQEGPAHARPIYSVNVSPDGQRAVDASMDGTAYVWNLSTGALIKSLTDGAQLVYATFSPDGSLVAGVDNTWQVPIWDATTGALLKKITSTADQITSANFSPDGSKIALSRYQGSQGPRIEIWDVATNALVQTWPTSAFPNFVTWRNDGLELAIALADGSAIAMDPANGKVIQTYFGHTRSVNTACFSSTGAMFLTGSNDGTSIIFDALSGKVIQTLVVSGAAVRSAFFDPSATAVVTASYDSTVRVWYLGSQFVLQDVSDSLWAIVLPTAKLATLNIDMYDVAVGNIKDSVVQATICNSGKWPLHVLGMDVTKGNSTDFMIMSGAGDFVLAPGDCRDVIFSFMPAKVGPSDAWVTVRTSYGTFSDTIHIFGVGVKNPITLEAGLIDFGTVALGSKKDMTVSAVLKNTGGGDIIFDRDAIAGPAAANFSMMAGSAPFTLKPGDEQGVTARFTPDATGRVSGRILYYYNGPGSPAIVTLFGKGIGGQVYLPDASGMPGDKITLPLVLAGPTQYITDAGGSGYKAEIALDASMLTPTDPTMRGKFSGGTQTITMTGLWDGKTNILGTLPVTVALGTSMSSPLVVSSFTWLDQKGAPVPLDYSDSNGTFTLQGVCAQGGNRLFNPSVPITLSQSRPNPAHTSAQIDFSTAEQGTTKLFVTDVLGRTIMTLVESELSTGPHTATLNTEHLADGVYYYILQTPSQRLVKAMEISK